jgi:hypothetical protein
MINISIVGNGEISLVLIVTVVVSNESGIEKAE